MPFSRFRLSIRAPLSCSAVASSLIGGAILMAPILMAPMPAAAQLSGPDGVYPGTPDGDYQPPAPVYRSEDPVARPLDPVTADVPYTQSEVPIDVPPSDPLTVDPLASRLDAAANRDDRQLTREQRHVDGAYHFGDPIYDPLVSDPIPLPPHPPRRGRRG